jgi:transcriptional regulator with XRE-family HTH domain
MADLGHTIRSIREARKLSLAQVASAANVGTSFLSLVELNERKASSDTLRLIAKAISVPEELLLAGAGLIPISRKRNQRVEKLAESLNRLQAAEAALRQRLGVGDGTA